MKHIKCLVWNEIPKISCEEQPYRYIFGKYTENKFLAVFFCHTYSVINAPS